MSEIELIKEKINVVDLINEYLPIKKSGINYKGLCPFHQEKSPSFMVSPERGTWHCFGCDKGGDIFKFLMEKEGIAFPEALEILAQKAGVPLQTKRQEKQSTDVYYEIHQKAAQFFHYFLKEHPTGQKALEYLKSRGLTDETIEEFQIGYAPNSWENLTKFLKKKGYQIKDIIDSGLAVPSNKGGYDRFRGRVMFPLYDVRDRVIGFSGRVLLGGEPKYINSPQTPIFDKSKFLFGIHLSKQHIRESKEAILVEGEMDMILSYQSGVKNIVASKGTALTENQIDLLKRYTDTLSMCFDTDLAGDAASRRGIEMADRAGCNLKVIQIPSGKDPAELCLKDVSAWQQSVKDAVPIYDYYLQSASKRFDPKTPFGKREIFHELIPVWQKITDPITQDHYIQKLSALLQTTDELIRQELAKPQVQPTVKEIVQPEPIKDTPKKKTEIPNRQYLLEEYLLTLLLHLPVNYTFVPNFPETLLVREEIKQIYVLLVLHLDSIAFRSKAFKINQFTKDLPPELLEIVDKLYLQEVDSKLENAKSWQKEVDTVTLELKKILIKTSLEKLSAQIKSAQSFDEADNLTILNKRFRDLSMKLRNL